MEDEEETGTTSKDKMTLKHLCALFSPVTLEIEPCGVRMSAGRLLLRPSVT